MTPQPQIEGEELLREMRDLSYQILNTMDADRKPQPPYDHSRGNWASEIGHPCALHLVYCRTHWKEKQPMGIDGVYRVEEGKKQELVVTRSLEDAGFEVTLNQVHFSWPEYKLSGRTDGGIALTRDYIRQILPIEITTVQPWYWDTTRTIEEVKHHKKWWISRKPHQLNSYFLMQNLPGGILIIKTFGKRPRLLPMLLDYEMGERDIKMCELVNKHVAAGTLPERMAYDPVVCGMCSFNHICGPIRPADISDVPPELIADLKRYVELQPSIEEYRALKNRLVGDRDIPGYFRGKNIFYEGITVKSNSFTTRRVKGLPDDLREKYTVESEVVRTDIYGSETFDDV